MTELWVQILKKPKPSNVHRRKWFNSSSIYNRFLLIDTSNYRNTNKMERTLTIKYGRKEIQLSDLDKDNDIEISITDVDFDEVQEIYLNKDDLISLVKHLQYLIDKTK